MVDRLLDSSIQFLVLVGSHCRHPAAADAYCDLDKREGKDGFIGIVEWCEISSSRPLELQFGRRSGRQLLANAAITSPRPLPAWTSRCQLDIGLG